MAKNGLDADKSEDRKICAKAGMDRYYREVTAACRVDNPDMPVFHNSGHVEKGNRGMLKYFSHLELESLPTGGWGYDHFPMSTKYVQKLGLDYLGMTGKFHTTWGEFGGFKHPNALRFECAAMIANGAKCSVGDQLHPNGIMDPSTYEIIGAAYKEVEEKEPWCDNVSVVSDIAVLSSEAECEDRSPDTGIGRILLEEHILFDLLDRQMDFSGYKMLILPDVITIDDALKAKIDKYLADGGKLLLTGKSGLKKDGSGFAFDIGGDFEAESTFQPDFILPGADLAPSFVKSPIVMYMKSQQVKATKGEVLADIFEPYFNRNWKHFCSHQHAPYNNKSEFAGAIKNGNILYLAHPVFSIYYAYGAVVYKEYAFNAIKMLLGDGQSVTTNLPSTARVSLMKQAENNQYILHLLYANTIARGAAVEVYADGCYNPKGVEVIEELLPLRNIDIDIKLPESVKSVTLEPQGKEIPFTVADGVLKTTVDEFACHQMVVLHY